MNSGEFFVMKKAVSRLIDHLVGPFGLTCIVKPEISPVAVIPDQSLVNARILQDRWSGLHLLPKGGNVAEVGVAFGNFSRSILDIVQPELFVAIDTFELGQSNWGAKNTYSDILGNSTHEAYYRNRFESEIKNDRVEVKPCLSTTGLEEYQNKFFDMIYIDAAHDYENVRNDFSVARKKIKDEGVIIFNDYTMMDPLLLQPYGIVQAVHEVCESGDWEFVYLALHQYMFCDVAIRRII